jgi:hypothetical protein
MQSIAQRSVAGSSAGLVARSGARPPVRGVVRVQVRASRLGAPVSVDASWGVRTKRPVARAIGRLGCAPCTTRSHRAWGAGHPRVGAAATQP